MIRRITGKFTPKQYLVEFLFGLAGVLGFYLIIAWSSYSPFDSTWSVSSYQSEVINKTGKFGAWLVDLCFVLLGHVGNVIPFVLCIAPIYFIRTRRVDSLTWMRFSLRMFGFTVLLCGLTLLSTLLLEDSSYHLAGGVLGASLMKGLFPTFGQLGGLLLGIIFSVIGFIFCSGASLIRLLVRFYNWLTVQNEGKENATGLETQAVIAQDTADTAVEPPAQFITPEAEPIKPESIKPEPDAMNGTQNVAINITGLSTVQTVDNAQVAKEHLSPDDFGGYRVDQVGDLPEVSIVDADYTGDEWPATNTPVFLNPQEKSMLLQEELSASCDPIPTVQLTPPLLEPIETEDDSSLRAHQDTLAAEFAAQEQQYLNDMAQRAKEIHAEDALKVILGTTEASSTPAYKPYDNTLIHPLLQPKAVSGKKPTTPLPSLDLLD
ncbi:MAG TPA: cell division protein FtsK, partial [Pasteurellaceae bacterium]|nr:cell division protein FtsK [Pasteurellaceae bacterium]